MPRFLLAGLCALALCTSVSGAEDTAGVYVILDGSGSMWGQLSDGTHKITAAKEVVKRFTADDYERRELAFRVYGHRREGDCSDTELVVPFSAPEAAIERMASFADGVNPKGKTPISRSLRAALEDFGDRPGEIILISDGIETCDEDPCALVREWRARNVDIRVHVVGLGLEDRERRAMQCISDAAGTEYHDAQSADELAAGLHQIQEDAAERDEFVSPEWRALDIVATNSAGERMRVQGTASWEGGGPIEVSNNGHNKVPPGEIAVTVGVRTWNGNLYKPVTRTVTVEPLGETELTVVVPEPPSVRAKFLELGEAHRGSNVSAFQEDQEVLSFRAKDRAYVDPGTYEFRSSPNDDNELSLTESFAEGDHKEIVFELVQTVAVVLEFVASESGMPFVSNFELWQDGELRYKVHRWNGAQVLPGTYEARLPLFLTPYAQPGLVVTTESEQKHQIEVPVGHVTIRYQNSDGSPGDDRRSFMNRKTEDERWIKDKVTQSGKRVPLVPGEYRVEGFRGNFDPVFFEIAVGDEREIVLKEKGN